MGASQNAELLDSDTEHEEETDEESYDTPENSSSGYRPKTPSSLYDVDAKLKASISISNNPTMWELQCDGNLYLHIGGNTPTSKPNGSPRRSLLLIPLSRLPNWAATVKPTMKMRNQNQNLKEKVCGYWSLVTKSGLKLLLNNWRLLRTNAVLIFVAEGVWALKLFKDEDYGVFVIE